MRVEGALVLMVNHLPPEGPRTRADGFHECGAGKITVGDQAGTRLWAMIVPHLGGKTGLPLLHKPQSEFGHHIAASHQTLPRGAVQHGCPHEDDIIGNIG